MDLMIPSDAFSDGQVRSKLWLVKNLNKWANQHLDQAEYTLTWYGSWVGLGPFLLLGGSSLNIKTINLVEIDKQSLETSKHLLDHWKCTGVNINLIHENMNSYLPHKHIMNQIFINTACEHVLEKSWLENIPKDSWVILQSTDMAHLEHINLAHSMDEFVEETNSFLTPLEKEEMKVSYPNFSFSRFMIFGKR